MDKRLADSFREALAQEVAAERERRPDVHIDDPFDNAVTKKILDALTAGIGASAASAAQAAAPLAAMSDSRVVLQAAIEDSFDLDALKPSATERAALLDASDIVVVDGRRRLRLDDRARADVIGAARTHALYREVLADAVHRDAERHEEIGRDPVALPSAWLRCFLSGEFEALDTAPLSELRAACAARERLRYVEGLPTQVPPVSEMSRRVELAELLEPLRVLVGAAGGWDGTERRDRFVGRLSELGILRAFVDQLESQSLYEKGSRAVRRTVSAITQTPGLLMLYGRGGLGKSTLLAKFVLDHARNQQRPFPFAYLDFDRATLDATRSTQLLGEIARQIGLQFTEVRAELDALAEDIRASLASPAPPRTSERTSEIRDHVARFVEILRARVTSGRRTFLLILDTLEIVQWNSSAIASLASLIAEFRVKGLSELRVVASGRADIPELYSDEPPRPERNEAEEDYLSRLDKFLQNKRDIDLQPLTVAEAAQLATALGEATIGTKWRAPWSAAIAGTAEDNSIRREPLSVRVAVDLVARAEPSDRQRLVDDIRSAGAVASDDFVARLYEKRIVNHVQHPLARKLAWPGLVVRRITSDIARDLLAKHCDIPPEDAVKAVEELGREVWMVTRSDDGTLRHRPELRSRTLPLMRKKDPTQFGAISKGAVEYFARTAASNHEDYVEWVYHRLLLGEPPETMTRESEVFERFREVADDFPPPVASYIVSRTAVNRLPPPKLRQLRPADALYHLTRTSDDAFAFDDRSIDAEVQRIAQLIDSRLAVAGLEGAARTLWIKTGMWTRLAAPFDVDVTTGPEIRAHAFWAAHVAQSVGAQRKSELVSDYVTLVSARSYYREGRAGFRSTIQAMALARLANAEEFGELDRVATKMLGSVRPSSLPSIQAALRMAIVFGETSRAPALEVWLASRRRASDVRVRDMSLSRRELMTLARFDTDAASAIVAMLGEGDVAARVTESQILAAAFNALDEIHSALLSDVPLGARLGQLFALRNEDWIVPFGYAAARATEGRVAPAVRDRLNTYGPDRVMGPDEPRFDMLAAVRIADEAGDLPAFVELLAKEAGNAPAARDLNYLIDCRNGWSEAMGRLFEHTDVPPASTETTSDEPPPPGPVVHPDDLQKDRWGGRADVSGRRVSAVIDSVERNVFYFSATVESTDGTKLEGPVVFHLHDSYPRSVVRLKRVYDSRYVTLSEWSATGVFAIGVQVRDGFGRWMSLELDLANLPNLPPRFKSR